jgi:hypothetical protein
MNQTAQRLFYAALAIILLAVGPEASPARAAQADTGIPCQVAGTTALAGDSASRVDVNCDLSGRGALSDRLTIIDRAKDRPRSAGWPEVAGTTDATWLFDYQGDSTVELIVNFRSSGTALVAELYDAQGDPGRLSYRMSDNGQLIFNSQIAPTVRVVAPDGWWSNNGRVNFNLDIAVDGLVDAAFDVRNKLAKYAVTDGKLDFVIRIRDSDGDGRPDYDWRTLRYPDALAKTGLPHTFLMVNSADNEAPLVPVLPWPFLGGETYGYLIASAHQTSQPPIQVSWESGTISAVGEFVSSRGNDAQWFVYSPSEVKPGELSYPDFESPFAWYDLAQDHDRQPELAVRLGYYWANDPAFVKGRFNAPLNFVRYSWDQDNDGYWDYKLGLLGQNEVTSTVALDDLALQVVPYDQLPGWVVDRPWGVATFVAAEGVRAQGEGIYEWDPSTWLTEQYFTGFSTEPLPQEPGDADVHNDLRQIQTGYRGEYQLALGAKVELYISPIDHRLHLLRGAQGIWKIDDRTELRYANLNGDDYLDEWRYLVDGQLRRQLDVAAERLVYSGDGEIIVQQAQVPPALATLAPPKDHGDWLALQARLKETPPLKADDFKGMLAQFSGPRLHIQGAALRDFRQTEQGFRFILDLQPGFSVDGNDDLGVRGREPGAYAVTYDRTYSIAPLTPPQLSLSVQLPQQAGQAPNAPIPVRVQATNQGTQDIRGLTLVAEARQGGAPIEVARQPIDILAGQPVDATFTWQPVLLGDWQLDVRLEDADGHVVAQQSQSLAVKASAASDERTILTDSTGDRHRLPAALILGLLACFAILAVRILRGDTHMEQKA